MADQSKTTLDGLTPALPADLVEALHYALRFDERGKPRGATARANAEGTAQWLAKHLDRAGFVIMRRPPIRSHTAG